MAICEDTPEETIHWKATRGANRNLGMSQEVYFFGIVAIAARLEAIASRSEAIALRLEAITIRLDQIGIEMYRLYQHGAQCCSGKIYSISARQIVTWL